MTGKTISFYEANAASYYAQTFSVDMSYARDRFIKYLPARGLILDFGCGSGRDTGCFGQAGYSVDAIDGSKELAKLASKNTGVQVRCMRFQELSESGRYDGIWACASILHLDKRELREVLQKMKTALKPGGVIYASFKYGTFEGFRGERYYTDFTEQSFREYIRDIGNLRIIEEWVSADVRPGQAAEKWLNVIMK